MALTLGIIVLDGQNAGDIITKLFASGTSWNNNWVTKHTGVISKRNLATLSPADSVSADPTCKNTPTADLTYGEFQIEVKPYGIVLEQCYEDLIATLQEANMANGGANEWSQALIRNFIEQVMKSFSKQIGKAVWQGVEGGATGIHILDLFNGLETTILADGTTNKLTTQPAVTVANVVSEIQSFINYIATLGNSEDILNADGNATDASKPAIYIPFNMWNLLKAARLSADFNANFTIDETNEYNGLFQGFTIRPDLLSTGTMVAGHPANLHVAVDGQYGDSVNGTSARLIDKRDQGEDLFKFIFKDKIGTQITNGSQLAIRTL